MSTTTLTLLPSRASTDDFTFRSVGQSYGDALSFTQGDFASRMSDIRPGQPRRPLRWRSTGMWRSLASAPALGAGGREFKSPHPDVKQWNFRPWPL